MKLGIRQLIFSLGLVTLSGVARGQTCVVSFLADATVERRLIHETRQWVRRMDGDAQFERLHFKTNLTVGHLATQALRECLLDARVEEVVWIVHSDLRHKGYPKILMPSETPGPTSTFEPIKDEMFSSLQIHPQLRQLTLILLESEQSAHQFSKFQSLLSRAHPTISVRVLPLYWWRKRFENETRSITAILAESVQQDVKNQPSFFCYIGPLWPGSQTSACARNQATIRFRRGLGHMLAAEWMHFVKGEHGYFADIRVAPGSQLHQIMTQDQTGVLFFRTGNRNFSFRSEAGIDLQFR